MRAPLLAHLSPLSASAVQYYALQSYHETAHDAVEANASHLMPCAGRLKGFHGRLTTAPGAGKNHQLTVMHNGVASALAATVSDSETEALDFADYLDFVENDTLSLRTTPSGTPAIADVPIGFDFECDEGQIILSGNPNASANTTSNTAIPLQAGAATTTLASFGSIIPTAGMLKRLHVKAGVAPGSGKTWTITLMKNGAVTDLVAVISGAGTVAVNNQNSVIAAPGDRFYWRIAASGTPTAARILISCVWAPDIDGESIHTYSASGVNLPTAATQVFMSEGGGDTGSWSTTGDLRAALAVVPGTLKKLHVRLRTAPGSGKSYTFYPQVNLIDLTALSVTLSGTTTLATNDVDKVYSQGNYLHVMSALPAGTPAASACSWSYVLDTGGNSTFEDTFAGSDAAVPDPTKWAVDNLASALADIRSNALRLQHEASGSSLVRIAARMKPMVNQGALFRWKKSQNAQNASGRFYLRATGWTDYVNSSAPDIGVGLQIISNTNQIDLIGYSSAGLTSLSSAITYPAVNDTSWHWCRFRVYKNRVYVKFWADAETEPVDWTQQAPLTLSDLLRPGIFLAVVSREAATAVGSFSIDDLKITELSVTELIAVS